MECETPIRGHGHPQRNARRADRALEFRTSVGGLKATNMAIDVGQTWYRIDRVLRQYSLDAAMTLQLPAWDRDIEALEGIVRLKLPDDFSESLRVHDGQADPTGLLTIFGGGVLLDTIAIATTWRRYLNPEIPFRKARDSALNPNWLPFTRRGTDSLCIDLDPKSGTVGSVIAASFSARTTAAVAPSFGHWLQEMARALESREFIVSAESVFFDDVSGVRSTDFPKKRWR